MATRTWVGTTNTSWDTSTNWLVAPPVAGDSVYYDPSVVGFVHQLLVRPASAVTVVGLDFNLTTNASYTPNLSTVNVDGGTLYLTNTFNSNFRPTLGNVSNATILFEDNPTGDLEVNNLNNAVVSDDGGAGSGSTLRINGGTSGTVTVSSAGLALIVATIGGTLNLAAQLTDIVWNGGGSGIINVTAPCSIIEIDDSGTVTFNATGAGNVLDLEGNAVTNSNTVSGTSGGLVFDFFADYPAMCTVDGGPGRSHASGSIYRGTYPIYGGAPDSILFTGNGYTQYQTPTITSPGNFFCVVPPQEDTNVEVDLLDTLNSITFQLDMNVTITLASTPGVVGGGINDLIIGD